MLTRLRTVCGGVYFQKGNFFMLFDGKKIEFVLLEKLKGVDTKGWIFFAAAAVLAAALIIFLVQRRKKCTEPATFAGNPTPTVILVHGALCIAISFVLSYFKLFSMPNGGSITLASMLPLMVYSNRYGAKYGVMAGVVYGFLQYIQKPEMTHWIQMLVDYPVAFGVIGLGGPCKRRAQPRLLRSYRRHSALPLPPVHRCGFLRRICRGRTVRVHVFPSVQRSLHVCGHRSLRHHRNASAFPQGDPLRTQVLKHRTKPG